jgi:hypothetical protein
MELDSKVDLQHHPTRFQAIDFDRVDDVRQQPTGRFFGTVQHRSTTNQFLDKE